MEKINIAGHELTSGKTIKDHIHVGGTEIRIPHIIICGEKPGKTVLVTAGIHNAEYVGIQAAIELSNEISPKDLSGNLIIIPLANRSGFENRTMSLVYEDGKNLNRVFPGDKDGSAADRLASLLFDVFIKNADAYIDLHSGDGYETLIPYAYYVGASPASDIAKKMVDCVNASYCVKSTCTTEGAYNTASMAGIPSVLIERGQLSLLPKDEVQADKEDVLNILKFLGLIEGEYKTYPKTELREFSDDAPFTGCWYPEKKVGEKFSKGDKFGEIRDYFGRPLHTAIADTDGVLIHQCSSLSIIKNGPMVTYGVIQKQDAC
ncbi:succinylglutamate desuccinylase/aspartoacylase family protein [Butyrivibrio sp. WCD3002]|uniref:succinylglutamate desuccinylase/aspartoacylase family protein n=1 Tax=Butyrivibrio sp. WCD3002 TaxID=1280676 RepID=UPI0004226F32|nr:M14 family metallopeptidase [Butyrivibrio sp. WCD3002]